MFMLVNTKKIQIKYKIQTQKFIKNSTLIIQSVLFRFLISLDHFTSPKYAPKYDLTFGAYRKTSWVQRGIWRESLLSTEALQKTTYLYYILYCTAVSRWWTNSAWHWSLVLIRSSLYEFCVPPKMLFSRDNWTRLTFKKSDACK